MNALIVELKQCVSIIAQGGVLIKAQGRKLLRLIALVGLLLFLPPYLWSSFAMPPAISFFFWVVYGTSFTAAIFGYLFLRLPALQMPSAGTKAVSWRVLAAHYPQLWVGCAIGVLCTLSLMAGVAIIGPQNFPLAPALLNGVMEVGIVFLWGWILAVLHHQVFFQASLTQALKGNFFRTSLSFCSRLFWVVALLAISFWLPKALLDALFWLLGQSFGSFSPSILVWLGMIKQTLGYFMVGFTLCLFAIFIHCSAIQLRTEQGSFRDGGGKN